jgi:hypothetical protein
MIFLGTRCNQQPFQVGPPSPSRKELSNVSDEGARSMAAGDVRLADGRGQSDILKFRLLHRNLWISP